MYICEIFEERWITTVANGSNGSNSSSSSMVESIVRAFWMFMGKSKESSNAIESPSSDSHSIRKLLPIKHSIFYTCIHNPYPASVQTNEQIIKNCLSTKCDILQSDSNYRYMMEWTKCVSCWNIDSFITLCGNFCASKFVLSIVWVYVYGLAHSNE